MTIDSQRVPRSASSTSPAMGRSTRLLLTCGLVAGPLYILVGLGQALLRSGYDPARQDLSLLSNGNLGWLQISNFVISGGLTVAFAVGLARSLETGLGRTWGPRLIALYGLGLIAAGAFVADPMNGFPPGTPSGKALHPTWHGTMHVVSGSIAFVGLIAACFVFHREDPPCLAGWAGLAGPPQWESSTWSRSWALPADRRSQARLSSLSRLDSRWQLSWAGPGSSPWPLGTGQPAILSRIGRIEEMCMRSVCLAMKVTRCVACNASELRRSFASSPLPRSFHRPRGQG